MRNTLRISIFPILLGVFFAPLSAFAMTEIQVNSDGTVPSPYVQTTWAFGTYSPSATSSSVMDTFVYYGYNTWNTDRITQGVPAALNIYCSNSTSGIWNGYGYSPTNIGSSTASLAYSQAHADFHFSYLCSSGTFLSGSNGTVISYIAPAMSSVSATSTSFTFTVAGHITTADWTSNTTVTVNASSNAYNQVSSVYTSANAQHSFTWSIPSAGDFYVSTTTNIQDIGTYQMATAINNPQYSLFGLEFGNTILTSSSTQFTVGTTTVLDAVVQDFTDSYNALIKAGTGTNYCAIAAFDLSKCLISFFIPNTAQLYALAQSAENGFLSAYPWGYITRIATIISNSATSTLPSINLTSPTTINGQVFPVSFALSYNPWSAFPASGSSLVDIATSSDGHTLREAVEPYWNDVVYIAFAFAIVPLITGIIVIPNETESQTFSTTVDEQGKKRSMFRTSRTTTSKRRHL